MSKYIIPSEEVVIKAEDAASALRDRLGEIDRELLKAKRKKVDTRVIEVQQQATQRQLRIAEFKARELRADRDCFLRMRRSDRADMFETLLNDLKDSFRFASAVADESTVERLRKTIANAEELR